MSIEISPDEVSTATRVADKIISRHRGIVEHDDVVSELTLWMLGHEEQVLRLRARGHGLFTTLYREGQRYVVRERAQVFGYRAEDQFRYSPALLYELLKEALPLDQDLEQRGEPEREGRSYDPFRGDRLVMLIDARVAVSRLSPLQAQRLQEAAGVDWDLTTLAELWSTEERPLTTDAVRLRLKRAMQRLSDAMSELRADHEYVGTRRAVSNARANAALRAGASSPTPHRHPQSRGGGVLS